MKQYAALADFSFRWNYAMKVPDEYNGKLNRKKNTIDFTVNGTPFSIDLTGREADLIEDLEKLKLDELNGHTFDTSGVMVMDGDSWMLNIAYGGKRICASGSNAYPPQFEELMELLHRKYNLPIADIEREETEDLEDE